MYIDKISKDEINYAHIVSNLRSPHKIILSTEDYVLFYVPETDYYYAECDSKSGKEKEVCNKLKELGFNYLSTTNEKISKEMTSKYSEPYIQYVYKGEEIPEAKVLIEKEEKEETKQIEE